MEYRVEMKIYNTFKIEAHSEEEASQKALALGVFDTLDGASYDVVEVESLHFEKDGKVSAFLGS